MRDSDSSTGIAGLHRQEVNFFWSNPYRGGDLQHFRCDNDFFYPPRVSAEYAIVFCLTGTLEVSEGGRRETLTGGEVLIGNPGLWRSSGYLGRNEPCEGVTLILRSSRLTRFLQESRFPKTNGTQLFLGKIRAPNLADVAGRIVDEFREQRPGSNLVLDGIIQQLVMESIWQWPKNLIVERQQLLPALLPRRFYVKAVEYMHTRRKSSFRVSELCSWLGTSPSSFRRLLAASARCTPLGLHCQVLMQQAQGLLAQDSLSVKQVAYELGFRSDAHFCTLFQRRTGMSPGEFRHRSRGSFRTAVTLA